MPALSRLLLPLSTVLLLVPAPAAAQAPTDEAWESRVREMRALTAGMVATLEEMPGPQGGPAARDRWDRYARALALEAGRAWAVLARFGFEPPAVEGLEWDRGRGVEERFVRRTGPWTREELRVLASTAFADLVEHMEDLSHEERRRVDRSSGLTQADWLAGLAPTFAAKLGVLEHWARRSAGGG